MAIDVCFVDKPCSCIYASINQFSERANCLLEVTIRYDFFVYLATVLSSELIVNIGFYPFLCSAFIQRAHASTVHLSLLKVSFQPCLLKCLAA